jgi:hypothetical protein
LKHMSSRFCCRMSLSVVWRAVRCPLILHFPVDRCRWVVLFLFYDKFCRYCPS